jgi:F-type H+-transporting ATPase subunit b
MGNFMGALGINLPTLVSQLISFLVLFGLLMLIAYKPIVKMFDERSKRIKESLEQAELVKQQAASADEAVKKQLEAAAREGQEVISKAIRTGEGMKQEAQQQAKQEAEKLINRARAEIQRERDEAIDSVRQEFADLTIMAASKVVEKSLDQKAHRELIDKVLEESKTIKKG